MTETIKIGVNIGKSRLSDVALAIGKPPGFTVVYGVDLSDFDQAKLEQLHYEWASCTDGQRMFAIVGAGELPLIERTRSGPLWQMFQTFVLVGSDDEQNRVLEAIANVSSAEIVDDPDQMGIILVDCLDNDGVFDHGIFRKFVAGPLDAAPVVEPMSPIPVAEAALEIVETNPIETSK